MGSGRWKVGYKPAWFLENQISRESDIFNFRNKSADLTCVSYWWEKCILVKNILRVFLFITGISLNGKAVFSQMFVLMLFHRYYACTYYTRNRTSCISETHFESNEHCTRL